MEGNNELLKYIYHEDLYIIDEPAKSTYPEAVIEDKISSDLNLQNPSIVQEAKPVTFFGNNEKGILILVNDPANEYLNQKELRFLMSIIESGLRYSKNDLALVNIAVYSDEQAMDEIEHNYMISFNDNDLPSREYGSKYQVIEKDSKKMLFAEKLSVIEADVEKKKLVWKALKTMFNI